MNEQFIQRLTIDWNAIDKDSYLREIASIKDLKELNFENSVTFFELTVINCMNIKKMRGYYVFYKISLLQNISGRFQNCNAFSSLQRT